MQNLTTVCMFFLFLIKNKEWERKQSHLRSLRGYRLGLVHLQTETVQELWCCRCQPKKVQAQTRQERLSHRAFCNPASLLLSLHKQARKEIIWSNTCFLLIKKKKSKTWERREELKPVLLKKKRKIKAGLPLTQSPPLIMVSLLSLSFDISSNPASRGFTINTCSWANYLNDLYFLIW